MIFFLLKNAKLFWLTGKFSQVYWHLIALLMYYGEILWWHLKSLDWQKCATIIWKDWYNLYANSLYHQGLFPRSPCLKTTRKALRAKRDNLFVFCLQNAASFDKSQLLRHFWVFFKHCVQRVLIISMLDMLVILTSTFQVLFKWSDAS